MTTRLRNIGTADFQFRLQEQEVNQQTHQQETISYIAWEPSSGTVDGITFEVNWTADAVTHKPYRISFQETFLDVPVFLADMQTTDGGDTANLRWEKKDTYSVDVHVDEEQSKDGETNHTTEVVGYILLTPQQ